MKKFSSLLLGALQKEDPPGTLRFWSASTVYKPGDLILSNNEQVLTCRQAPFGDFCNLNPTTRGGLVAWSEQSKAAVQDQTEINELPCRSSGRFVTGDLYCDEKNYVWRCQNNENCNTIYPLQDMGWFMWETWELIPAAPLKVVEHGISVVSLIDMIQKVPLQDGYEVALGPLVLPISLVEFKKCFLEDDSPYFDDKFLSYIGSGIISLENWMPISPDAHDDQKTVFGQPVIKTRKLKISSSIPNPFSPTFYSDVDYFCYKEDGLNVNWKSVTSQPNQYLFDNFEVMENWEVMTSDTSAN